VIRPAPRTRLIPKVLTMWSGWLRSTSVVKGNAFSRSY
jgi:hypothetical protein